NLVSIDGIKFARTNGEFHADISAMKIPNIDGKNGFYGFKRIPNPFADNDAEDCRISLEIKISKTKSIIYESISMKIRVGEIP
ncbi:MAG: hypothetical protein LBG48_02255, partial [Rickettsiales bacterium]|nr:hypothetical protein [Rickettsiales bacterium]